MKTAIKTAIRNNTSNQPGSPCCSTAEQLCPVETTIHLIGGKYKSLILWKLMGGALRFSQLRQEVLCATAKTLTQQLRELEADGMVHREVFPVVPSKVEYSLTDFGRSIAPVLAAMYEWGTGYLNSQGLTANCSMVPFEK